MINVNVTPAIAAWARDYTVRAPGSVTPMVALWQRRRAPRRAAACQAISEAVECAAMLSPWPCVARSLLSLSLSP